MPANTSLEFQDKEIQAALKQWTSRLDQISKKDKKVLRILTEIARTDVEDHFAKEMGPDGRKWEEWSQSYAEYMARIGKGSNQILTDSGKLRRGFKANNVSVQGDDIIWYNEEKTSKGFPYAEAHNEGGGKLPQRQFMWISDRALDDMIDGLLRFWEDG